MVKKMPPEYCPFCEEKLSSVKWYPFCDNKCCMHAINAGWQKLNGRWTK